MTSLPSFVHVFIYAVEGSSIRIKDLFLLCVCDLDQLVDFKQIYELSYSGVFFFRNRHMIGSWFLSTFTTC